MGEVSPRSYARWAIDRSKEGFQGMSKERITAITKKMRGLEKDRKISEELMSVFLGDHTKRRTR
jgi:hypothetical protein